MITKVKGTQDFVDLTLFNYVVSTIKSHVTKYHFNEIITPILEPTELFKRTLGVATDVVTKEMFIIKSTKDDNAICLRPEATASIMRAFLENNIATTPWKVFSCGPMFRHERPQKGRYREFRQVTIENIGAQSVAHDAQLITMLDRLFSEQLSLNNYALMINFLGCKDDRTAYTNTLKTFLMQPNITQSICDLCRDRTEKNTLRTLDCKNETCKKIYETAPQLPNNLCAACTEEWKAVQNLLNILSVSYVVQPHLVRGLDYYNKTVFEFSSDNLGSQNAFCAGGRYDTLAQEIGSKHDQPSLGAAIGIERLLLLLEPIQDQLPIPAKSALHVIIPIDQAQQPLALMLADDLQSKGIPVDVLLDGSVKSMMRKANKMGASTALLIGQEEQDQKTVSIKNMITGETKSVSQVDAAQWLKK